MQKLPYTLITRSISVSEELLSKFLVFLKLKNKTFSRWVRDKMEEELK